jgi:uncharacterized membrane protein YedE/YeeE
MRNTIFNIVKFVGLGIFFGIVMTKAEVISWYRIQEMFLFDNFHMYGVIGTAVVLGLISVQLMKKYKAKDINGHEIKFEPKAFSVARYLFGGTIFGFGWAMTGACPGPMYTLVGHGYWAMLIVIAAALFGTFIYGMVKSKLPH